MLIDARADRLFKRKVNGVYLFTCYPVIISEIDGYTVTLVNRKSGAHLNSGKIFCKTEEQAIEEANKYRASGAIADELAEVDESIVSSMLIKAGPAYSKCYEMRSFTDIFDWQIAVIDAGLEVVQISKTAFEAIIPDLMYKAMLYRRYHNGQTLESIEQYGYGSFKIFSGYSPSPYDDSGVFSDIESFGNLNRAFI